MTFANSLDPEQDSQIVGPDLDTSRLTLIVFQKEFNEKLLLLLLNSFPTMWHFDKTLDSDEPVQHPFKLRNYK